MKKINILTGAAGFISSVTGSYLSNAGMDNILAIDDFSKTEKSKNWENKKYIDLLDRNELEQWFEKNHSEVNSVIHLGARTDTTEFDKTVFDKLNVNYTKMIWKFCTQYKIPLIYASSAATYGGGELGYDDDHKIIPDLKPLNQYGNSKQEFDVWALSQKETPPYWAGLKFFNVFGPNEYHKKRMASVIFHSYNQIKANGEVKLFRSHKPQFADGMQIRDFVYVKDVASVICFLLENRPQSGIFNLGTGKARPFLHLAEAVFDAMEIKRNISFIDIPEDIRDKYQYFTEAKIDKLRSIGYSKAFHTLEEGVFDYVKNYLIPNKYI